MDDPLTLRIEYIEARRVLLDALGALRPHLDAVVLIGAQAVYLRTAGRLPTYQPYTTDADIVLDPARLLDNPPLGRSMSDAGFVLTDEPGIWEARFKRVGFGEEIVVPVDLIVPEQVASKAGRRSARLPGEHGKNSARKSPGVEATLVDYGSIEIASFERSDTRSVVVNVAGEAALLVAKLHKLGDRLEKPERLEAKDAGDVYRLFDAVGATRCRRAARCRPQSNGHRRAHHVLAIATGRGVAMSNNAKHTPADPMDQVVVYLTASGQGVGQRLGLDTIDKRLRTTTLRCWSRWWAGSREDYDLPSATTSPRGH